MSDPVAAVRAAVGYIAAHQQRDGAIPPSAGGTLDPWDHVECAMALDAGGRAQEFVVSVPPAEPAAAAAGP